MGNGNGGVNNNTNNVVVVNTKFTKTEKLMKEFKKSIEILDSQNFESFNEFKNSELLLKIYNIQLDINEELIKIRNLNLRFKNLDEYTNNTITIKKLNDKIKNITHEYFNIVKKKTKNFI